MWFTSLLCWIIFFWLIHVMKSLERYRHSGLWQFIQAIRSCSSYCSAAVHIKNTTFYMSGSHVWSFPKLKDFIVLTPTAHINWNFGFIVTVQGNTQCTKHLAHNVPNVYSVHTIHPALWKGNSLDDIKIVPSYKLGFAANHQLQQEVQRWAQSQGERKSCFQF